MPLSGQDETTGEVYVLGRFLNRRLYRAKPHTNAERHDTDFFYEEGLYDPFPNRKKGYEDRRKREQSKAHSVNDWAVAALIALDEGRPLPATTRLVLPEVLSAIHQAGYRGLTRPEMCQILHRDGGKVSGCMTDLHAARIIFPLDGERR